VERRKKAPFDSFEYEFPHTPSQRQQPPPLECMLPEELTLRLIPLTIHSPPPRGGTLIHIRLCKTVPQGHCHRGPPLRLWLPRPLILPFHLQLPTINLGLSEHCTPCQLATDGPTRADWDGYSSMRLHQTGSPLGCLSLWLQVRQRWLIQYIATKQVPK
jgi:hypothetical protein